jgi:hypothetical protein
MSMPQFTADAALPRANGRHPFHAAVLAGDRDGSVTPALVGRWHIPWTRCEVSCIEVCTRFCAPTGWDCCGWETRCAVTCDGQVVLTNY